MKASKESSLRLCLLGDVPPSAACQGVLGVISGASDPARGSGGSRCRAPPGVLASARSARLARGAAPAQSMAEGLGAVRTGGVRSWSLGFRVRLASCQCLVKAHRGGMAAIGAPVR